MTEDTKHAAFTEWAKEQGVVINGVAAVNLPGKGYGVVATTKLKKGETIVSIPASAFITHDSGFVSAAGIASNATVYGAVAAALTLNHGNVDNTYARWQATWPSRQDFERIMPLCWTSAQHDLLPSAARTLLQKQQDKYVADVKAVKSSLATDSGLDKDWQEWYRYYWLIVNTRCFYWVYFKKARDLAKRGKKLARDECLALVPWGDYFNHQDTGCRVTENATSVTVVTNRAYANGEEVVTSYGAHSNDCLLVEYGFTLDKNRYDHTTIDHIILPMLNSSQKVLLEEQGFLGQYYITSEGFCYRTQVALWSTILSTKHLKQLIVDEYEPIAREADKFKAKRKAVCRSLRAEYRQGISSTSESTDYAMQMIRTRWTQLLTMLDRAEVAL